LSDERDVQSKNESPGRIIAPKIPVENFKQKYKSAYDERITSAFVILDFEPAELARQMTLMEFSIFKKVKPREWIDNNWVKTEKLSNAPNVCKLSQLDNHIVNWIVSELILVSDAELRAKTMEHLIKTMQVRF
jgi:hypothetical protein